MNIPATMDPESSEPYDLSCPISDTYYTWQGTKTSAQYYVNKAGVSLAEGCTWSSAGSDKGNWAPVVSWLFSWEGRKKKRVMAD